MTLFDELAEKLGDDEWDLWKKQVLDSQEEIAAFVTRHHSGDGAEVLDWFQGSFNFCLQIMYSNGTPDVMIRFPRPGHTTFRDEKVVNEVQVIKFLHENTTIPVPRLISWGLTKGSPQHFGPFIISEFVKGVHLSDVLKDPAVKKRIYLNPYIDTDVLNNVYSQIADIMLQLYGFEFDCIGAISKDESTGSWSVTSRPLTYSMNELATTTFFPTDKFLTAPFTSTAKYFHSLISEHKTHLYTQRNLCGSPLEASNHYISCHLFAQSVDQYCINESGPFKLFCDDFRPQNILIDPVTLRVKAVLDLEFTNAMPSQFASEPPWWLLLVGPDSYLLRDRTIEEWVEAYEPRLEQFLGVLERVEEARGGVNGEESLSRSMRESWASKRFWFNYAIRKPFDVEVFFHSRLRDGNVGLEALDEEARQGLEPFVETKMEQLKAYDRECAEAL